ncbi:hypothetical protein SAMN05428642_1102 [Flaviramulus basaltis]|uniref:Uncharacterized protein n=1 Tax=Flaviramulus basaltis TaxID=369401 RepID=A0A1K2IS27_9FLAO|nr:hypothetical protein SAMN05428642_1102 [Flaviramulus basaltis]
METQNTPVHSNVSLLKPTMYKKNTILVFNQKVGTVLLASDFPTENPRIQNRTSFIRERWQ